MFFSESPLFSSGGRSNYRIPTIVSANDGTIHAFCNDRHDSLADHAEETALVYARKKPGQAWEAVKTLDAIPGWCCLIGSAVYDGETDTVFCTVLRKPVAIDEFGTFTEDEIRQKEEEAKKKALAIGADYGDILFQSSDGGDTWTCSPLNLIPRVFETEDGRRIDLGGLCHGSASGIQLRHGKHPGRLLCPSRVFTGRYSSWEQARLCCYNNSIYSDDHGATWYASAPVQQGTGEGTLIEDADGTIFYNSRALNLDGKRQLAVSTDSGETYHSFSIDPFHFEEKYGCNASFLRVERSALPDLPEGMDSLTLFANPRADNRSNMTLSLSFDSSKTWSRLKTIWTGGCAYSSLTYDKTSRHFFLLYEKGSEAKNPYEYGLVVLEFDLEWLLSENG